MDVDITKLINAAKAGGEVSTKYFGQVLAIEEKSTAADFRTKADVEAEEAILTVLRADFPSFNFHSEEAGKINSGSEYTFVIDPLDGSNNFVLGIPNFSVSIALQKYHETIAAVVYQPILKQTYHAEKEKGSFLDKKQMHVSTIADISKATIGYGCSYTIDPERENREISILNRDAKRVLNSWSPAYDFCMLANGKIEAMVSDGLEIYDFAAGRLFVKEAGGIITDFTGKTDNDENTQFVASNGTEIHQYIIQKLPRQR